MHSRRPDLELIKTMFQVLVPLRKRTLISCAWTCEMEEPPTRKIQSFSLSHHLVSIEGAEHVVHVGVFLLGRAAGDAKYLLELVKMQLPAGTLAGELPVELLDVLQGHLLLLATLRLAHSHRHENPQ